MKIESMPLELIVLDRNEPVPGDDGIITNNLVTEDSIQVLWSAATDAETPQGELEYILYRSSENIISTIAEAERYGTVVQDWQAGITTAIVTGLDPGTTYFFNVVVRDGDGLKAAYRTVSITTLTNMVYLFPAGSHKGNLLSDPLKSVRDNVDDLCMQARLKDHPEMPCLNVRAFISISPSDDIAGMPGNYGVPTGKKIVGPNGDRDFPSVGATWADLLDGLIGATLTDAGVTGESWWSGSLADGTFDASDNCGGWMTTDEKGASGKPNKTDAGWITGNSPNCNDAQVVLCVCW